MQTRLYTPFVIVLLSFLVIYPLWAKESPLKIEVFLKDPTLKQFDKDPTSLAISTKIINISDNEQKIPVWLCSYGSSWVASTPAIITGIESCNKNFVQNIVLKPRESFSRDLSIAVSSWAKPGSLFFELGFNPAPDWFGTRRGINQTMERLNGIIWSNPLTITVTADMASSALRISDDLQEKSIRDFHLHWGGAVYNSEEVPDKLRQCASDADCGSVKVGCWSWAIANRTHLNDVRGMYPLACLQSTDPGPKPQTECIDRICVDKWKACTQDSDCTVSKLNCPFAGGWKPVNRQHIGELEAGEKEYLKKDFKQTCTQSDTDDGFKPAASCIDKSCQLIW